MTVNLSWLPKPKDWESGLKRAAGESDAKQQWAMLTALAKHDLDIFQVGKLDRLMTKIGDAAKAFASRRLKIALIGTGTLDHLAAPIRVACARRNISAEVFVGGYNLFQNELLDAASSLRGFSPDVVVFSIDARYIYGLAGGDISRTVSALERFWSIAKSDLGAFVVQQTFLPVFPDVLGSNENRLPGSRSGFIAALNQALLKPSAEADVALLDVGRYASLEGLESWHDPAIWHHAKQEIHPHASPLYGDYVARLVAAKNGRSAKCIVLDLDNTLWGGVIGDDGVDGIRLGQGSAEGEAYIEFQQFILAQKARGLVLAVCSKNDHQIAVEAFDKHSEMQIRRSDFAAFVANWDNKVDNLKRIAAELNLGADALLFVDDNPAERELVRRELPEVMVPELPEDPAYYAQCISRSGFLEAIVVTEEDMLRADQYQANLERARLQESSTDIDGYLEGLDMELEWGRVDSESFARVVQLANKTNQFNLTTRRYSDAEMLQMMVDPNWIVVWARLKDKFGDNGIIAVGALHIDGDNVTVDNWLMSCRVFGRQVEDEMMNLFVAAASARGVARIRGGYKSTPKNGIVENLYARLGFESIEATPESALWSLEISRYSPKPTRIRSREMQ